MFLPRPIHPYYFHADLIWWDGPFKPLKSDFRDLKTKFPFNLERKCQRSALTEDLSKETTFDFY